METRSGKFCQFGLAAMAQMVRMVDDSHAGEQRHSSAGREEMQGRLQTTSSNMAPSFDKGFDHEEDHDHDHHGKKSVLAKVKEKARKWKQVLAKRRHGAGPDHENSNSTPAWGVSLDEDEELEDPDYHAAPMYETELVQDAYKDAPTHHETPRPLSETEKLRMLIPESVTITNCTDQASAERRAEDFRMTRSKTLYETMAADRRSLLLGESSKTFNKSVSDVTETKPSEKSTFTTSSPTPAPTTISTNDENNKTLTSSVTQILAPAYAMVADATHLVASKIQGVVGASPTAPVSGERPSGEQIWDKGISVKEYLMQKLEPGPEEKVLSRVISEAMSPRKDGDKGDQVGVVGKVKEAVTSLLGKEEQEQVVISTTSVDSIPVSEHPHAVGELDDQVHGRKLQTN